MNIINIINNLAKNRPVFHSEADFQHALAWSIHKQHQGAKIRLEIHPERLGRREYLDLWVEIDKKVYAIELKYKTKATEINYNNENFLLMNHDAQDNGRYDFIKDIVRVEKLLNFHKYHKGYAILLTNDPLYWEQPRSALTIDADFRLHEDKALKGNLKWSPNASPGTIGGRKKVLSLKSNYRLNWVDFSIIEKYNLGLFRLLLVEIKINS